MPDRKLMSNANASLTSDDLTTPLGHFVGTDNSWSNVPGQGSDGILSIEDWEKERHGRECFENFTQHVMIPKK